MIRQRKKKNQTVKGEKRRRRDLGAEIGGEDSLRRWRRRARDWDWKLEMEWELEKRERAGIVGVRPPTWVGVLFGCGGKREGKRRRWSAIQRLRYFILFIAVINHYFVMWFRTWTRGKTKREDKMGNNDKDFAFLSIHWSINLDVSAFGWGWDLHLFRI